MFTTALMAHAACELDKQLCLVALVLNMHFRNITRLTVCWVRVYRLISIPPPLFIRRQTLSAALSYLAA